MTAMTTRDIELHGIRLRMTRNANSAFVGILRLGRVAGGEIFGYIARLNSDSPTWRVFRYAAWPGSSGDLDTIAEYAWRFHNDVALTETREAVGTRGR